MTRLMFDSTTPADVPDGSPIVMGYVYEPRIPPPDFQGWPDAAWSSFPGRILARLCVYTDRFDAQIIDSEPRNNDAHACVPWIRGKWDRGQTPTVYCESDEGAPGYRVRDFVSECDAAGVKLPLFLVAKYDGIAQLPTYADPRVVIIGKQYANEPLTGGHYDASVVQNFWPGVDEGGGDMTDAELLAALKRIYAGPDSPEEWVKADVRVMVQSDPVTRQAVAAIAAATAPAPAPHQHTVTVTGTGKTT